MPVDIIHDFKYETNADYLSDFENGSYMKSKITYQI